MSTHQHQGTTGAEAILAATRSPVARLSLLLGLVIFGIGQSLLFVIFGPVAIELDLAKSDVGLIFSASGLAVVIAASRWGKLSSRWGRKPVFILGLIGYAIGTTVFTTFLEFGLWGWIGGGVLFAVLVATRVLHGLLASAIQPAATAYIADTTDAQSRAKGMALMGASSGLGTILGPALGGGLAVMGLLFPLYVSAVLALLVALFAVFFLPEPPRHASEGRTGGLKFWDRRVAPYLFLWFVLFTTFISVQVITAFYIEDRFDFRGEALAQVASLALVCMALASIFVQAVILQMFKLPPKVLLRACFPLYGLSLLVLALADSLFMVFAAYVLLGIAFSFANPGINASATLSVSRAEQGAAAGLLTAAPTSGVVIGPLLGTALYELGTTVPMWVGVGLMALSTLVALFITPPDPRRPEAM